MVCKKCNTEYSDSAKFCPHCGKVNDVAADAAHQTQYAYSTDTSYQQPQQLQQQPQQQPRKAVQQPQQPAAVNTYTQPEAPAAAPGGLQPSPFDGTSILLCIISFFEPFVGLILYLSWYKEYPKRAKGVGLAALIRVILVVLFGLVGIILAATVFAPIVAEVAEEIIYGIEDAFYYMF